MQLHQQEPRAPRTLDAPSARPWAPIIAVIALTATIGTIVLARALAPSQPDGEDLARSAADRFLDRYLEPDGRVVRRDQGGDTVSEGQAYAMLLAVATGDRRRFELAWSWARTHLQREDGLLSWRWEQGRVADANPASDADVDAAHALVLAAHRFRQPDYLQEGRRLARSILTEETVVIGDGTSVLVAGPWARQEPYIINPSYFAPGSFAVLGEATGDPQWRLLVRSSHQLVSRLTGDPPALPPDWARLEHDGRVQPIASPSGAPRQPRFSFDAPRLLVRLAADCSRLSRDLAMASGGLLPLEPGRVAAAYSLRGVPLADYGHPLTHVAAAATASAAGDPSATGRLLAHAEALDRRSPTYYGAAWLALGRVMLTTTLLSNCPAFSASHQARSRHD